MKIEALYTAEMLAHFISAHHINPENGGNICVQNVGNTTSVYTGLTYINPEEGGSMYRQITDISAHIHTVRFEVSTAVTMKNAVFWDVMPCGPWKNRRFEGT
jgi:hypothetical protein